MNAQTAQGRTTMRSYRLEKLGHLDGIVPREEPIPTPEPTDILVRVHAVSLNRRDALILHERYPLPSAPGVVPISDGAGEVVAVGREVTRFKVGDRIVSGYWPRWHDGRLKPEFLDQFGCTLDGMLTEYVLLDQQWAVHVPDHLSWEEAATLPCAGVTAWNSIVGGEPLRPGQTVLTLGTGSVSLFALQFAKMLGCRVISTTSSEIKAGKLKELGADHVINYVDTPEWGQAVRELTEGRGADLIVETNGPATIEQSVRAAALYGQIVLLSVSDPTGRHRSHIEISGEAYGSALATIRRIFVGNRADHEAMNQAITAHHLRPVIDRVFGFADTHDAFTYYLGSEPFGKVIIRID
ncbi:zinc-dependent alcohol dehydrogenase family protein [Streptosporangium lutulentum]|uniref:NADPH:quinone reductase-like Zn-dependent oxidoreductase n=1 Tax=Streptosporangium lutulentum TaxID=1461250 RepID=A0ABT9QCQ2_9ACTN|nr:NAD(P)-dependent alcohol dehydrogenase [Streptosporangium lutulentum]MDP9844447.1 NADPH:quinone reductase-like Zn-dependent oxidoreductase [Streptosporangium lutulentum]